MRLQKGGVEGQTAESSRMDLSNNHRIVGENGAASRKRGEEGENQKGGDVLKSLVD